MADVFNAQGQKIGYTDRSGQFRPVNNNNSNFNANNSANKPQYKKSGATYSTIRIGSFEGATIVNAWRSTKMGLLTAKVTPYAGANGKGTEIVESVNKTTGHVKEYAKMLCTITNASLGTNQVYHVLMNLQTKVISIPELSLCITPNGSGTTKSGKRVTGYFGKNFKSK